MSKIGKTLDTLSKSMDHHGKESDKHSMKAQSYHDKARKVGRAHKSYKTFIEKRKSHMNAHKAHEKLYYKSADLHDGLSFYSKPTDKNATKALGNYKAAKAKLFPKKTTTIKVKAEHPAELKMKRSIKNREEPLHKMKRVKVTKLETKMGKASHTIKSSGSHGNAGRRLSEAHKKAIGTGVRAAWAKRKRSRSKKK